MPRVTEKTTVEPSTARQREPPSAVHLDIDGQLTLENPAPTPVATSPQERDPPPPPKAEQLHRLIHLQRAMLLLQRRRIERQRLLIARLHRAVARQQQREQPPRKACWLRALFSR